MKIYIGARSEIKTMEQFINDWAGAVANLRPAYKKLQKLIDSGLPDAYSIDWYFYDCDEPEFSVLIDNGIEPEDRICECIKTSAKSCGFVVSRLNSDRYQVRADFSFRKYVV